jgi:hypothetical protein
LNAEDDSTRIAIGRLLEKWGYDVVQTQDGHGAHQTLVGSNRYRLKARGVDLDVVAHRVTELLDIPMDELWSRGKHRHVVKARSLLCYWAVHELHMSMSELALRFEVSATTSSKSVLRGKALAKKHDFELE